MNILPYTIHRYGHTVSEVISNINIILLIVEDGQFYLLRGPAAMPIAAI